MSIKIVRCYGSRKRAIVEDGSQCSSREQDCRQFAKNNLRAQHCVNVENLTWADALDPTVVVGSEDPIGKCGQVSHVLMQLIRHYADDINFERKKCLAKPGLLQQRTVSEWERKQVADIAKRKKARYSVVNLCASGNADSVVRFLV